MRRMGLTSVRLPFFAVGLWVALAAGCAGERFEWDIVYDPACLSSRAVTFEASILRGDCTSADVVYSATFVRGAKGAIPPELEAGRYGFAGRAADDSGSWFAEGCVEADIPRTESLQVVLRPTTAGVECPDDAGSLVDGSVREGGSDDAAMDAGPESIDAAAADAGPGGLDAAPTDAPPLDTGSTDDAGGLDAGCGVDPLPPGAGTCPVECTGGCGGGVCTIECLSTSSCEGLSIVCPAAYACTLVCGGRNACRSASVACPADYACTIECQTEEDVCRAMDVYCGSASCAMQCGSSGDSKGGCDGAIVHCGRGACSASCERGTEPTLICGSACSCSPC